MTEEEGRILLEIARGEVNHRLRGSLRPEPDAEWLRERGATFVTITERGDLRGCIGSLEPSLRLIDDVRQNAWAAATRDPRFPPLIDSDLDGVLFEVSILTPMEPLEVDSEEELLRELTPGSDGIYLRDEYRSATFLPQVWESFPAPVDFLANLKLKAGLPADHWSESMEIFVYRVLKFSESGLFRRRAT